MTQQAKPAFSFKQNKEEHLPHAKPRPAPEQPTLRGKPGPKIDPEAGKRDKAVVGYLSEQEEQAWKEKLDGRPGSVMIRRLILQFMADE